MRLRSWLFAPLLLTMTGLQAQSSGQFLFTLTDGRTFVRMLPADWAPRFDQAFLYFTPRDRLFVADIAAIQPLHPDDVRDHRQVKLLFRSQMGRGSQVFWVPNMYPKLEDAPHDHGFLVLGPQTLVREGVYREVLE